MNNFFSTFLLSVTMGILALSNVNAGFYNGGTFQSKVLNLSVGGTLENNGSLIGTESANIKCDTFAGNKKGLLKAPVITLTADVFNYKGIIQCSNQCTLIVKEPFNKKMFKRKGKGRFEIIITGDAHEEASRSLEQEGLSLDCCLID